MKPRLLIGLGNPLMGDDGVGWYVASRLAGDPRLPPDVESLWGGTDLLRHATRIAGRAHVLLVDALQGDAGAAPGTVTAIEDFSGLDDRQANAHALSAVQAIGLLRMMTPVRMTLLAVSVLSAGAGNRLSAELELRMPAILDRVLEELGHAGSVSQAGRG